MAGYSGAPLAKKLGIGPGARVFVEKPPRPYSDVVTPLPDGVRLQRRPDETTDVVHVFVTVRSALVAFLEKTLGRLRPDAAIWVSWPKKASKMATDVTEDVVREIALPLGLVDVKVCAVDEVWSGLKLVVRKENRR